MIQFIYKNPRIQLKHQYTTQNNDNIYDTLANKQEGSGYYVGSGSKDTVVLLFCDTEWSLFYGSCSFHIIYKTKYWSGEIWTHVSNWTELF